MDSENRNPVNERMEQVSLNELMPGFNKEDEWQKLNAKLRHGNNKRIEFTWLRAAATLLLLAGGGWLTWFFMKENGGQQVAQSVIADTAQVIAQAPETKIDIDAVAAQVDAQAINEKDVATKNVARQIAKTGGTTAIVRKKRESGNNATAGNTEKFFNYYMANEFVCNGTQCPLEICIVQTFKCQNAKPSAVATCSTLAPDEAKQLRYKAIDRKGKDCKVTVDEIRIKRVSTGETIVLNSNSKPSTAEELFSCITGESKCNILAGIFDADCNNHCNQDNLTIYNHQGNVIMQ